MGTPGGNDVLMDLSGGDPVDGQQTSIMEDIALTL